MKLFNSIYYRLFKFFNNLYVQYFKRLPLKKCGVQNDVEKEVIVSFTTVPKRIDLLPLVIKSMFRQTVQPDRFVLYIFKEEFETMELANLLKEEIGLGLEIKEVEENLRSHKKYYYAMNENPNSIVITIDDDLIYPSKTIERLINSYKKNPHAISALRCHKIVLDSNNLVLPYKEWEYERFGGEEPSHLNFLTSGAGTLFPPIFQHTDLLNKELFQKLSFSADDVWINFIAIQNNIKVVKATMFRGTPIEVRTDLENSLAYINVVDGNNDTCISNMISYYNIEFGERI